VGSRFGEKSDAAGDEDAGGAARGGERHHHGGKDFVAGGDTEDAFARGERAHEAAEDNCGVVAVGERGEHADGALGAAVPGGGAGAGEGDGVAITQFARGFGDEETDFPVTGVEAAGDGGAVLRACRRGC
jgi:hypothetical protein